MRKNLQHIELKELEDEIPELDLKNFLTCENILLKKKYSKKDIEHLTHLDFGAGFAPNLRGPYSTMYIKKTWDIHQKVAFFGTPDSNAFYKKNWAASQKQFSLALDWPTHQGYDSDDERAINNVGKAGVAIDSVEDMKLLFDQIPLNDLSLFINTSGAVLPLMAFYIATAQEQGLKLDSLSGTLQNDILKELVIHNTPIYPPASSLKIIEDIVEYTNQKMPKFNSVSISGHYLHEAGATTDIELAYTLAYGLQYIKTRLATGIKLDEIAPKVSFFWTTGMTHFIEIAKLRAGRMIWAKLLKQFNPKNEKSFILKAHCQISPYNLTARDPFNNIARTCIQATAAVFGGTQSLDTTTLDQSLALPTDYPPSIGTNTQLFLQEETKITKTVDPWAGSYYVESLTNEIVINTWKLIQEIEELGGITKAIQSGIPKLRIEQAAARKQARIENQQDHIVGLTQYQLEKENPLPILDSKDQTVHQQIEKLRQIKANRNYAKVENSLKKLISCAQTGQGNLLEFTIEAAQNRATLGEISSALETVFGKYKP